MKQIHNIGTGVGIQEAYGIGIHLEISRDRNRRVPILLFRNKNWLWIEPYNTFFLALDEALNSDVR